MRIDRSSSGMLRCAELNALPNQIATWLLVNGVEKNDDVAIMLSEFAQDNFT